MLNKLFCDRFCCKRLNMSDAIEDQDSNDNVNNNSEEKNREDIDGTKSQQIPWS